MVIKKTSRISLVEQVVLQIEKLIETGHWAIGDKIPPEMELMDQFDVSRNTLREAIRALVHAGLLETKQGSGTIVKSKSALSVAIYRHIEKSSLIETLEVRLALEREAAQMAAERRNEKDLETLNECIIKCQEAVKESNFEQFIQADIMFHKAIVKASHNQLLIDLYEHMTNALYTSVRDLVMMRSPLNYEEDIHGDLLEAIRKQDINKAIKYVDKYINKLKESLKNMMEE